MRRFRIISGVVATIGAGGMLLGAAAPSNAAVTNQKTNQQTATQQQATTVKFAKRYFECYPDIGCRTTAQLPRTWRYVRLGSSQTRFLDDAHNRMIRFNTSYGGRVSTATALKRKVAALKGTRGLHIVGTSTVTMRSTSGQGPLKVSTLVYTYRSGNITRWVATRYVALWGTTEAEVEISVAGSPRDSKLLGTVINRATQSVTLAG